MGSGAVVGRQKVQGYGSGSPAAYVRASQTSVHTSTWSLSEGCGDTGGRAHSGESAFLTSSQAMLLLLPA